MNIAFLGDSLTAGWPGASYLSLLRNLLPSHTLIDHGRAGDTIADLRTRMIATDMDPVDLAVIWVGINDAFVRDWDSPMMLEDAPRVPRTLTRLRGDYTEVLGFAIRHATMVVCVPPVLPDGAEPRWQTNVQRVRLAVDDLVSLHPGVVLFDLAAAFDLAGSGEVETHFTIDGVHLSDRGAGVVAQAFAQLIQEQLEP